MLIPIQAIALIQGIVLLIFLIKKRRSYEKISFLLLFLTILSVLLFLLGDDDNSLFFKGKDLFLFDSSLFVTFLLLFIKYHRNDGIFKRLDLIYFLPNFIYFSLELYEIYFTDNNIIIETLEILVTLTFLFYLIYAVYLIKKLNKPTYFYYILIPLVIFQGISSTSELFQFDETVFFSSNNLNTVLLLLNSFLFYFLTFLLLNNKENTLLAMKPKKKYTNSSLSEKEIQSYKKQIELALNEKEIYLDRNLDLQKFADELNISKTQLSEIISKGHGKTFNDLINFYRVKKFEELIIKPEYKSYSILGVAEIAGFNSKTTFNNAFKKVNGITPSQFKKSKE